MSDLWAAMPLISVLDVDERRLSASARTPDKHKAEFGQYLTPAPIAMFMASLFTGDFSPAVSLLDAGAGNGILTAAFLDRWLTSSPPGSLAQLTACELDSRLYQELGKTLDAYSARAAAEGRLVVASAVHDDFIEDACHLLLSTEEGPFTHAILNPPYKKIRTNARHRKLLSKVGIETVNLYSAFVALSILLLRSPGELVAIIPRSFCNGPYYRSFRRLLLREASIQHIHLFGARDQAFSGDNVLQENIIIHLAKGLLQGNVRISTSTGISLSDYTCRTVGVEDVIVPDDPEQFIRIPTSENRAHIRSLDRATVSLADLGIEVSTGPVVDFRLKDFLRRNIEPDCVPLLYPAHFSNCRLKWPIANRRKPNALVRTEATEKWLYPSGCYVVTRRFSSKEEKKRLVASIVLAHELPAARVGFENHLNVFHQGRRGLPEALAYGLMAYLNSSFLDAYFREFNGHTQVNATDLRQLPYPSRQTLMKLGQRIQALPLLNQTTIDALVAEFL